MDTTTLILVVGLALALAAVAWLVYDRQRSERLRDRFGPEYERAVDTTGDRRTAESELESRARRVEQLQIRPLEPAQRERFIEAWRAVQARFVDEPAGAVAEADDLVGEVMEARGYPVGDFDQRAADVSVDHPQVVHHYRTAHEIAGRQRGPDADTEALRQAMVHYRALFSDLLEVADEAPAAAAPADTTSTGTANGRDADGVAEAAGEPTRIRRRT